MLSSGSIGGDDEHISFKKWSKRFDADVAVTNSVTKVSGSILRAVKTTSIITMMRGNVIVMIWNSTHVQDAEDNQDGAMKSKKIVVGCMYKTEIAWFFSSKTYHSLSNYLSRAQCFLPCFSQLCFAYCVNYRCNIVIASPVEIFGRSQKSGIVNVMIR